MNQHRVLIASPASDACGGLAESLRHSNCTVVSVQSEEDAAETAKQLHPDVVIVDASRDELDPFNISLSIRALVDNHRAPVFVVSCCDSPEDGLNGQPSEAGKATAGCFGSLVERVTSYLSQPATKMTDVIAAGELEIDRGRHRVLIAGSDVELTPTEFRLLWELASEPGYAFSREDLARLCLGPNTSAGVRTIDAHIKSLRRKLAAHGSLVETVRGVGYRFHETAREAAVSNSG
ncbi:MAG: response regulator transcription factor [Pirellulales bacterium]|nr:response regulator transcription factor [Pirellulales bacterium]